MATAGVGEPMRRRNRMAQHALPNARPTRAVRDSYRACAIQVQPVSRNVARLTFAARAKRIDAKELLVSRWKWIATQFTGNCWSQELSAIARLGNDDPRSRDFRHP